MRRADFYLFVAPKVAAVSYLVELVRIDFVVILACRFLACPEWAFPAFHECEHSVVDGKHSLEIYAAAVAAGIKKKFKSWLFSRLNISVFTLLKSLLAALAVLIVFVELSISFSAVILRSTDVGVKARVGVGDDVCCWFWLNCFNAAPEFGETTRFICGLFIEPSCIFSKMPLLFWPAKFGLICC